MHLSPTNQTANVGTPVTVDIVYLAGGVEGVEFRTLFNPAMLQVLSVTSGSAFPWTNFVAGKNFIDNTNGLLGYGVAGPSARLGVIAVLPAADSRIDYPMACPVPGSKKWALRASKTTETFALTAGRKFDGTRAASDWAPALRYR
jgi:hypothetical protein